ncbi:MAG: short-chain dehydrogenase [Rhodospirillaceae bacterium]|nr:short-chain dehydrogenase [Rhodospirillaceae bacterium]|tara:strand:+ start:6821 stop:7579 length:759 start_codon:yes stop_codon:yes gene_type:complete
MGMLDGKAAFVTAAGGGIAGAIARRFGAEGAAVCCVDVVEETVAKTAADIEAAGGKAISKICNVADEEAVKKTVDDAASELGLLNVVVNAAATSEPLHTVANMPLEVWQDVLDVNLTGMFLVAKHAIPHMQAAGGGQFINISSTFGHIAWPQRPAYMATKGAVRQLSKSIALDFAEDNIRANSILPGAIETNRLLSRTPTMEQVREKMVPLHPIGRLGQPEDIANAAAFLASDESSFMTGSDVFVDGGFTAV